MIELNIGGDKVQGKFDYQALFRANNRFSSKDGANDGASSVWVELVTGEETALYKAIRVMLSDKYSDAAIYTYISKTVEGDGTTDQEQNLADLYDRLTNELKASSFFRHAATRFLEQTAKYGNFNPGEDATETQKIQAKAAKDTLTAIKKSLSSSTAPAKA